MRLSMMSLDKVFQSTLPQGERLATSVRVSIFSLCFNPRSRKGCDIYKLEAKSSILVSIHAPARGATWIHEPCLYGWIVSIHAPARGATRFRCLLCLNLRCFNPRSRKGSDTLRTVFAFQPLLVSIHAPARGATFLFSYFLL